MLLVVLSGTAAFFFVATRGALILRAFSPAAQDDAAHVYPIYSNMRLIKLVDWQPVISAILLFQYRRLVSQICGEIGRLDLRGRKLLITSCAFGNVIPRVTKAAVEAGAERVLVTDIIRNELVHARSKLGEFGDKVEFLEENATGMQLADGAVAANVIFFLLHELPHHLKGRALREAGRVLAPGGKLFLAEFHRPDSRILRGFSWLYFKVFEPLGLALWSTHDPVALLEGSGEWNFERTTCCLGNFQVIVATKR